MNSSNPPNYPNYSDYSTLPPSESQDYTPPPPSQPQQYYPPPQPSQPQQYYPPPPPSVPKSTYPQAHQTPPSPYGSQPVSGIPDYKGSTSVAWSTDLFGCSEDVPNSIITWCCPCITFGQIAEIVDQGSTSCAASAAIYCLLAQFACVPCIYSFGFRSKLRNLYTLHESPCPDFLVHCCCEPCALCQEYRELQNRGFDMSIGWQGNVEKQRREMEMPPMAQGMIR